MNITYNLTHEDYLNFNMFHFKNSKAAMKTLKRQRFLYPFILLLFSYPFSNIARRTLRIFIFMVFNLWNTLGHILS